MDCSEVRDLLPFLCDDDVAADRRAHAEAHLAGCPGCTSDRQRLDDAVELLRSEQPYAAGAPATDRAHVDAVIASVARDVLARAGAVRDGAVRDGAARDGAARDGAARSERPRLFLVTHAAAAAAGILLTWGLGSMLGPLGGSATSDSKEGVELAGLERPSTVAQVTQEPPRAPARPSGETDGSAAGNTAGAETPSPHATGPLVASLDGNGSGDGERGSPRRETGPILEVAGGGARAAGGSWPHQRVLAIPVPLWLAGPSAVPMARSASEPAAVERASVAPLLARGVALLEQMAMAVEVATFPSEGVDLPGPNVGEREGLSSAPTPPNGLVAVEPRTPSGADRSEPGRPPQGARGGLDRASRSGSVTVRRDGERITLATRGEPADVVPALLALLDDPDPALVAVVDSRLRSIADELDRAAPGASGAGGGEDPWWRSARGAAADRLGEGSLAATGDRAASWAEWWLAVAPGLGSQRSGF